jgi:2-keto-4-pentenoate hydratase/2-oxohepta-3-ene-1,7-dioic acid hydratase in catechol pathway
MFSRRRVYCVGRNFAVHTVQIGRDMHSRALVAWPVSRGVDDAAALTITAV